MAQKYIKPIYLQILIPALILLALPPAVSAQNLQVKDIPRPASFTHHEMDSAECAKQYFSLFGTLDAIYRDYIVVDDKPCDLGPSANMYGLSEGTFVGVRLNPKGQAIAVKRLNPDIFEKD